MNYEDQIEFHPCQHDILLKDCQACLWERYKQLAVAEMTPRREVLTKPQRVALILSQMETEKRGDFLMEVATILDGETQFYTAALIRTIAHKYNNGEKP